MLRGPDIRDHGRGEFLHSPMLSCPSEPRWSPVLLQLSPARFFALGIAAASVGVVVTAYAAAGVTAYVSQPWMVRGSMIPVVAEPQVPNRSAKSNRMALLLDSPSYADFRPSVLALGFSAPSFSRRVDVSNNGILNEAQISGIEIRLRLTSEQSAYWPAVAAALRDVGRRYFQRRPTGQRADKVDVSSPEVQRLIETAVPLISLLSEDQKREVRQLVRIIGLETVASRI
jgi:hypothetical protein